LRVRRSAPWGVYPPPPLGFRGGGVDRLAPPEDLGGGRAAAPPLLRGADGRTTGGRVDGRGERLTGGRCPELGRDGKIALAPPADEDGRAVPVLPDPGLTTAPPGRACVAGAEGLRWRTGRSDPVLGAAGTARPPVGAVRDGVT